MNYLYRWMLPVFAGVHLDWILGDPRWLYHPVRMIGHLISGSEKIIRKCLPKTKLFESFGGGIMVVLVLLISTGLPMGILYAAYQKQLWLGITVEAFMCYQLLAARSLQKESDAVYLALKNEGLEAGRNAVSMIVGRDTKYLDTDGVLRATVETVAENTSDGVIAPLFYMFIGGAVWGFAYKAINTMDSMVGYQNEHYQYFGTAAAKLDDVANYIPARFSALLMVLSAYLLQMNGAHAWHIFLRDRYKHKSPNSAQTEAVMAGALEVRLAGDAWYFGRLHEKPTIGDALRSIELEDIRRSHRLMYATEILAVFVLGCFKWIIILWMFR